VEAKGYEVYNRFITLWPDNPSLEDIALVRLPEPIPPRTDPEKEVPKGTNEPKPSVYDQNTNYNRGVSNMQAGRYDLAINDFSQVIIGNPNHINAYYNRGVSYQKTGQNDKAIDDFKKVLELSNDPKVRERAKYNLRILGVK